jgi:hypothetical protein
VEEIGVRVIEGEDASGGEILRVDELIAVSAVADDPDFAVVLNELEEDGEQSETAAVDDGGAADGDDIEGRRLVVFEDLLGGELGLCRRARWVRVARLRRPRGRGSRPRGSWWRC